MAVDAENGSVRVSNADIYRLLLDTDKKVDSVKQTVEDVLRPRLDSVAKKAAELAKEKADKQALDRAEARLEKVEVRLYAIVSGLIAAIVGAKGIGIF